MHDNFQAEIWRLVAALLLTLLLGITSGWWALSLLLGLGGYIAWQFYQLYIFETWLVVGRKRSEKALAGVWHYAAQRIERVSNRSRKRKKRVGRIVQRFNRTLEAMPVAAAILTDQFRVEWYNSNAHRLLGFPWPKRKKSRVAGYHIEDECLTRYLQQGDFQEPLELPSPADPQIDLEVRVVPFSEGQYLLTAHDITQIKRVHAVRRRFIADVSHELRTPLTVITGYMELLTDEDLPAEISEALCAARRQAERMQSVVADLLMLSRLEMDEGVHLEGEPVAVAGLLEGLLADARQLSGEREHRFRLFAEPDLLLSGSESELSSAFGNLIFNAVNHTPPGTAIDVRWGGFADEARLEVADNGPGIEANHLQRLTERFYRVDKGRSRASGGTGLGLSIVKHVMNHHGGRVEIKSSEGKGSRFMCIFPACRILHDPDR